MIMDPLQALVLISSHFVMTRCHMKSWILPYVDLYIAILTLKVIVLWCILIALFLLNVIYILPQVVLRK